MIILIPPKRVLPSLQMEGCCSRLIPEAPRNPKRTYLAPLFAGARRSAGAARDREMGDAAKRGKAGASGGSMGQHSTLQDEHGRKMGEEHAPHHGNSTTVPCRFLLVGLARSTKAPSTKHLLHVSCV